MSGTKTQVAPPAERMIRAAADLLRTGGIDAVSTRAVAAAAGVQPPTIYRQFGDKDGLLDAVADFLLQPYIAEKRSLIEGSKDPVHDLHALWDLHVEFGLIEPHCYVLTYGQARPGRIPPAGKETIALLGDVIARIGDSGRLSMSVERATAYFRSTGTGYILNQIGLPPDARDPELSAIIYADTLAAITNTADGKPAVAPDLPGRAVALREALRDKKGLPLTGAERALLAEWLNRLADGGGGR
jgi:AcrR family transcriptional regulator